MFKFKERKRNSPSYVHVFVFVFVFIYLPHDYNNYKEMPKNNVGRNGEEA